MIPSLKDQSGFKTIRWSLQLCHMFIFASKRLLSEKKKKRNAAAGGRRSCENVGFQNKTGRALQTPRLCH